jgi:hypothetical protein
MTPSFFTSAATTGLELKLRAWRNTLRRVIGENIIFCKSRKDTRLEEIDRERRRSGVQVEVYMVFSNARIGRVMLLGNLLLGSIIPRGALMTVGPSYPCSTRHVLIIKKRHRGVSPKSRVRVSLERV